MTALRDRKLEHLKLFAEHARRDAHAEGYPKGDGRLGYKPVAGPLDDARLRAHLDGGTPLGAYLIAPGSAEVRVAGFDLDDHGGTVSWDEMRAVALRIAATARRFGLNVSATRSGGGRGVHLCARWDAAQPAAAVRWVMLDVLAAEGFGAGDGGVAKGQIEVFPKQDAVVAAGGYGNLIALPFARKSEPLDENMEPCEAPPLWTSSTPVVALPPDDGAEARSAADAGAVRDALAHVGADDYATWIRVGLALRNSLADAGLPVWMEWSKTSKKYPGEEKARKRWKGFRPRRDGVTVGSIFHLAREAGWAGAARAWAPPPEPPWPEPLGEAAYHGIAGEFVRAVAEQSEADPAALLVQLLVAFGNAAGRRAYYLVEADRHHANLFAALVGETSKARKGTSWGRVREPFEHVEGAWLADRVRSGLSSGEGLIEQVRDAVTKTTQDEKTGLFEEAVVDPGVDDKRVLLVEHEFSRPLRVMKRPENVLSAVLRDAWDGRDLAVMVRKSPLRATGPHVSMVVHSTVADLRRELDATDAANGFANRFLFACARRARLLPFGGAPTAAATAAIGKKLDALLTRDLSEEAPAEARVDFDDAARELWAGAYPRLSEGRPGMHGAITARAEAQVVRLALVYALLDGAAAIGEPHLEAAIEVWRYCDESAAHVFGDALGDPLADELLRLLRLAGVKGMTRTEISAALGGHTASAQIGRAVGALARAGRAAVEERRGTGGRSTEEWRAVIPLVSPIPRPGT